MRIVFFAEQLYYLPQFTPVIRELLARGHAVFTIVRLDKALRDTPLPELESLGPAHQLKRVENNADAHVEIRRISPAWAIFGSFFDPADKPPADTKTSLIYHGIGVKNVLFDPRLDVFDLRCVESERVFDGLVARAPRLRERLALVGFAKLDPLFSTRRHVQSIDDARPCLLYAPTFYPSSLELMPEDLRAIAPGARWIVKPHFFTWTVNKYERQRARLAAWARDPAIEVMGPQSYDLVPLMAQADVLISDASSALFEFAALGRPVVWCRFLKLRWSYRGLLRWRFDRRMDLNTPRYEAVARCVDSAADLPAAVKSALGGSDGGGSENTARETLIEHLIGPRDGRAAERIANELERRAPH